MPLMLEAVILRPPGLNQKLNYDESGKLLCTTTDHRVIDSASVTHDIYPRSTPTMSDRDRQNVRAEGGEHRNTKYCIK